MIDGALFDMDGVLIDSERIAWRIQKQVMLEMGFTAQEDLKDKIMGANHEQIKRTMGEIYGSSFDFEEFTKIKRERTYQELGENGVPKKEGVDFLLQYLKQNHYKIAVASSTRYETVVRLLKSANIFDYFDAIVGGDMLEKSKPEPDIFLAAAKKINIPSTNCVAIEDSANGVKSASSAGCITIMIPDMIQPTKELKSLANIVLPSLKDVPSFLEKIKQ